MCTMSGFRVYRCTSMGSFFVGDNEGSREGEVPWSHISFQYGYVTIRCLKGSFSTWRNHVGGWGSSWHCFLIWHDMTWLLRALQSQMDELMKAVIGFSCVLGRRDAWEAAPHRTRRSERQLRRISAKSRCSWNGGWLEILVALWLLWGVPEDDSTSCGNPPRWSRIKGSYLDGVKSRTCFLGF